ncbi:MAG: hypothetical protein PF637_08865 [Spirochaetes bacterium]|jgi:hypothetical protein|nr:hypothetical protein [Spirochaetota bacterium]
MNSKITGPLLIIILLLIGACETEDSNSKKNEPEETNQTDSTGCDGSVAGSKDENSKSVKEISRIPLPDFCGTVIRVGTKISFRSSAETIQLWIHNVESSATDPTWIEKSAHTFTTTGTITVWARPSGSDNADEIYKRIYTVKENYPTAAASTGSDAIHKDSPLFTAWATGYSDYRPGENVSENWQNPNNALGKAVGSSTAIVSLGDGGSIVLTMDRPVINGLGADFAVFENSFSDTFLELAWVEVSSDGVNFVRFENHSLTDKPVGGFADVYPENIFGFAGRFRQGYGTPFDLSELEYHADVRNGTVDLYNITAIRLVDIKGDGSDYDSFGNIIYDPYPTSESVGFDLDAIGIIE